jgi:hypothetical protein
MSALRDPQGNSSREAHGTVVTGRAFWALHPAKGIADTITSIPMSYCDSPPAFTTRVVNHEGKELRLVDIAESA